MSEFWSYMAPFLITAVALPAAILLGLKLRPSDVWSETVIRKWADSEGLQVVAIDDAEWFYRNYSRLYRVRVLDKTGFERECKALVGHLLLRATYRNISIKWINDR
jgi:hypothetical protein